MKLLAFGLFVASLAVSAPPSEQGASPKAGYSEAGIKRLQDNVALLNENIKDAEANLTNTQKNVATVSQELEEIRKLTDEYIDLSNKFSSKIQTARDELQANDEALIKLKKFVKTLELARKKQGDTQAIRIQMESATREIGGRDRWNVDALEKLQRLKEMFANLESTTKLVKAKRPNLEKELALWKRQAQEFQATSEAFKKQKSEYEQLIAQRILAPERGAP